MRVDELINQIIHMREVHLVNTHDDDFALYGSMLDINTSFNETRTTCGDEPEQVIVGQRSLSLTITVQCNYVIDENNNIIGPLNV